MNYNWIAINNKKKKKIKGHKNPWWESLLIDGGLIAGSLALDVMSDGVASILTGGELETLEATPEELSAIDNENILEGYRKITPTKSEIERQFEKGNLQRTTRFFKKQTPSLKKNIISSVLSTGGNFALFQGTDYLLTKQFSLQSALLNLSIAGVSFFRVFGTLFRQTLKESETPLGIVIQRLIENANIQYSNNDIYKQVLFEKLDELQLKINDLEKITTTELKQIKAQQIIIDLEPLIKNDVNLEYEFRTILNKIENINYETTFRNTGDGFTINDNRVLDYVYNQIDIRTQRRKFVDILNDIGHKIDAVAMRLNPFYALRLLDKYFFKELRKNLNDTFRDNEFYLRLRKLTDFRVRNVLNNSLKRNNEGEIDNILREKNRVKKGDNLYNYEYRFQEINQKNIWLFNSEWITGVSVIPQNPELQGFFFGSKTRSDTEYLLEKKLGKGNYLNIKVDITIYFDRNQSNGKPPVVQRGLYYSNVREFILAGESGRGGEYYLKKIAWGKIADLLFAGSPFFDNLVFGSFTKSFQTLRWLYFDYTDAKKYIGNYHKIYNSPRGLTFSQVAGSTILWGAFKNMGFSKYYASALAQLSIGNTSRASRLFKQRSRTLTKYVGYGSSNPQINSNLYSTRDRFNDYAYKRNQQRLYYRRYRQKGSKLTLRR